MRVHRVHQFIEAWSTGAPIVDPARLATVRIEPVLRARRAGLSLDFHLADGCDTTVIPIVLADPSVIVERDRDPLVFPVGAPGGDAFAAALGAAVAPHLLRLVISGERIVEHYVTFGASSAFEAARAAGCFGAAPLREALARLAPYRYARRFSRGRRVGIDAPDAIGGWAMLRDIASAGVAPRFRDRAAIGWYGEPPALPAHPEVWIASGDAPASDAPCVIRLDGEAPPSGAALVDVVDPLPLDVPISFDPAEGPARRWFAIERAPEPPVRRFAVVGAGPQGGSAGRIAVILGRADSAASPSADSDEAEALVVALTAEGFDAFRAGVPGELQGADLVHCLGSRDGARTRAIVEAARRLGLPVVLQPQDDDAASGGWWGTEVARLCFEYGDDERAVSGYLALLAKRAVAVGPAVADAPYAPAAAGIADALVALREASIVIAGSEMEGERLRKRAGDPRSIALVPPVPSFADPAPIGALVGPDAFALVHAPIGPAGNQLLVAHAAAALRIPLVVAGPVVDASYLERAREYGGPGLVILAGEPPAPVAAALRAAAAVVVDAAWLGEGASRLAGAALAGTRLALAAPRSFAVAGVQPRRFDPADLASLARALGEAWDDAQRAPARCAAETAEALARSRIVRALGAAYAEAVSAAQRAEPLPK